VRLERDLAGTDRLRRTGAGPDDLPTRVPAMVRSRFVVTPGRRVDAQAMPYGRSG